MLSLWSPGNAQTGPRRISVEELHVLLSQLKLGEERALGAKGVRALGGALQALLSDQPDGSVDRCLVACTLSHLCAAQARGTPPRSPCLPVCTWAWAWSQRRNQWACGGVVNHGQRHGTVSRVRRGARAGAGTVSRMRSERTGSELPSPAAWPQATSKARLKFTFSVFDTNKDGMLQRGEVKAFFAMFEAPTFAG